MNKQKYAFSAAVVILLISAALRLFSYPVMTPDYTDALTPWFNTLCDNPGLSAFSEPFSNYSPLYLYILKILTFLPFSSLYAIKTVSVAFDVFLAWVIYKIMRLIKGDSYGRGEYLLVFAVAFSIPTMILNSALWGQCDSIYSSFVLLSFYFILRDKPLGASLAIGIALAFKLQAIFFLPFFLAYVFGKKSGFAYLLILPFVYIVTIIPAAIGGGSFFQLLTIYASQTTQYQALTLFAPTVYSFLGDLFPGEGAAKILSYAGILVAAVFSLYFIWSMSRKMREEDMSIDYFLSVALLSVVTVIFFLPHMHERYFYLADVFAVLYAIYNPRKWYLALLVIAASFFSYAPFLSIREPVFSLIVVNEAVLGALVLLAIIILLYAIMPLWRNRQSYSRPIMPDSN